jgi:hypothetical protein
MTQINILRQPVAHNAIFVHEGQESHFMVYHDPSPEFVGRGVSIAVNRKLGHLTNITYGSNIDKTAAGRLIIGDITFATKDGEIKTIELTSFYVPCDALLCTV